jgi:hypothetical protein
MKPEVLLGNPVWIANVTVIQRELPCGAENIALTPRNLLMLILGITIKAMAALIVRTA